MKILLRTLVVILGSGLFVNTVSAQRVDKNDTTPRSDEEQRRIIDQQHRDAKAMQDRMLGNRNEPFIIPVGRPPISKEKMEKTKEALKELSVIESMLLAPSEYYDKYAEFLKSRKTGLARLFVNKNCDQGKTVTVQELERCADVIPVKGGGSFYSFISRSNNRAGRDWWDIQFVDDKFVVGNDRVQSIIVELGDIDLKDARKSKALKYLNKYEMKDTLAEIKEQNKILEKGIQYNGFIYSNTASTKVNQTYILRTVAYLHNEIPRFYFRETGTDLTIAFKVVGREPDGSLILLWKELRLELPRQELK